MKYYIPLCCFILILGCTTTRNQPEHPMHAPPEDTSFEGLSSEAVGPNALGPRSSEPQFQASAEEVENFKVARQLVTSFTNRGPSYALTLVEVEPVRSGNGLQGYRITSIADRARPFLPQLRHGDVITHINGYKQERPDDFLNAWKLLEEIDEIRIDFLRDDTPHTATWSVE